MLSLPTRMGDMDKVNLRLFNSFNSDQKRVIYAYLCALGISTISVILTQNFSCGATLLLFLSPFTRALFALPNTSQNIEPAHYQFEDGRVLPVVAYRGYLKRVLILTPLLIMGLLTLAILWFDHSLFGFMAFLLILSYNTALSAYLVSKKLPLLSWEIDQDPHSAMDHPPTPDIKLMKEDVFNRTSYDPKYSNVPGNIFNPAYRPKNH